MWALALDGCRLVSASLDATIVVRSFRPADAAQQGGAAAGWLESCGDLAASASEAGSDAGLDSDEEGSEEGSDEGSDEDSGSEWEGDEEEAGGEDGGGWAANDAVAAAGGA